MHKGVTLAVASFIIFSTLTVSLTQTVQAASCSSPIPLIGHDPMGITANPDTNMIYVATAGSGSLSVIDGNTNCFLSNVPLGGNTVDVAVNPKTNMIYETDNEFGRIFVINGATSTLVDTISPGGEPSGVEVNPKTNMIYVANQIGAIN